MTRHYKPSDLGPLCSAGCGTRVVRQLAEQGIGEHPACDRPTVLRLQAEASWEAVP